MNIKEFYEKNKNTPVIYIALVLAGILIKAILDIVTFAGSSLNFIFNYDFDSALFRKIPVINTIYFIFSIGILILSIKYIHQNKNKLMILFSGLFVVSALSISRFIIAGIAISVVNLYYNLEIIAREDIYIFFQPGISLLLISLMVLIVSIVYLCRKRISKFSLIILLNVIFAAFSNTYFNTFIAREDSCFHFFELENQIYRTRGLEIDCTIYGNLYLEKIYPLINLGFYLIVVILICRYLKKNNINLFGKKEN